MNRQIGINICMVVLLILIAGNSAAAASEPDQWWPAHSHDKAGSRYSPVNQINRQNVGNLKVAWVYRTGEMLRRADKIPQSKNSGTPITVAGNLILCTPFNRIIALDPATGKERWVYDPDVSMDLQPPAPYACRGVSGWLDDELKEGDKCQERIIFNTNDLRLIAIDARTGKVCPGFGDQGQVMLSATRPMVYPGELRHLMPPAIINGVVVIGSAIMDNHRQATPSGRVQAFDARTGKRLWEFDPIPRSVDDPMSAEWPGDSAENTGSANVWGHMSVDEARDLIFLPTSSAAPDYFGGNRPGNNHYANSVVALRGATGEVVWHYQIVHHDIWNFDLPPQPSLVDLSLDGEHVPALVQNTKQGLIFVFNRETGEPVFPIEERAVPKGDVPGEWYSPTQPFPVAMPAVAPQGITPDDAWGFTFWDEGECRKLIEKSVYGGLYTPPSLKGTVFVPWTSGGGANWGGPAIDQKSQVMVINTNRIAEHIQLIPISEIENAKGEEKEKYTDATVMAGTPYAVRKSFLMSPFGAPCVKPPWGGLTAVDLVKRKILWDVPLGTIAEMLPVPLPIKLGTPNMGGPIITAGGLVFISAAMDRRLRAFDIDTGKELWSDKLPADSQATPMTYKVNGEQYIVVTAGGHGQMHNKRGDYVVAFKLDNNQ